MCLYHRRVKERAEIHCTLSVAAGKYDRWSLASASNCDDSASRHYVTDKHTKLLYLVDNVADLCVYPRSPPWRTKVIDGLRVARSQWTMLQTYGCIDLCLGLALRWEFS
jgi:hypothetical protein